MEEVHEISRDEQRRIQILDASYNVFAAYGFKRTSMDDIAKEAGISRPALYQNFANKNDIFRALISSWVHDNLIALNDELKNHSDLMELLDRIFFLSVLEPHTTLEAMPHGAELLGLKQDLAQDLFDDWMLDCRAIYAEAFSQNEKINESLSQDLAEMVTGTIAGMKARQASATELKAGFETLKRIVAAMVGG